MLHSGRVGDGYDGGSKMVLKKEENKIKTAEKDFQKLWKEIEPFVKKRESKRVTTAGHWSVADRDAVEVKDRKR
jgi:hypothetical protein